LPDASRRERPDPNYKAVTGIVLPYVIAARGSEEISPNEQWTGSEKATGEYWKGCKKTLENYSRIKLSKSLKQRVLRLEG
jgi:hypothetical protein